MLKLKFAWMLTAFLLLPTMACTQAVDQEIRPFSHLDGVVTVSAEVDSIGDYSGTEVIVTDGNEDGADTLGFAITDHDGRFSLDVDAAERGIFPLILKRGASVLNVSQLVVAPGDTAHMTAQLPLGNRIPIIKSYENSAWLAFRNADATHRDQVTKLLNEGTGTQAEIGRTVELASEVLWSIRSSYPGTMAADLASAKSVVMLEGWNDSLVVARLEDLDPEAPGFAESVQAGGRAEARLRGIDSGIALFERKKNQTSNPEARAIIQHEITRANLDVGRREQAIAAAESLKVHNPGTQWADWADRAQYEARNLMRGDPAPRFTLKSRDGTTVTLDSLLGKVVVLDFWSPRDRTALQEIPEIRQIVDSDGWSLGLVWVSVGLEPDDDLYDAFFEGRDVPGIQIRDSDAVTQDLATRYNVEIVPTRYLIGADGTIIEKYAGAVILELSADIENMSAGG